MADLTTAAERLDQTAAELAGAAEPSNGTWSSNEKLAAELHNLAAYLRMKAADSQTAAAADQSAPASAPAPDLKAQLEAMAAACADCLAALTGARPAHNDDMLRHEFEHHAQKLAELAAQAAPPAEPSA